MTKSLTPFESLQLDREVYEELLSSIGSRKKHPIDHMQVMARI
jgi:hypothetical protein